MKTCTHCGWQMKDDASFCSKCGQRMGPAGQNAAGGQNAVPGQNVVPRQNAVPGQNVVPGQYAVPPGPQPPQPPVKPPKKKKSHFALILILVFVLACALTAGAVTVIRLKKNSPVLKGIEELESSAVAAESTETAAESVEKPEETGGSQAVEETTAAETAAVQEKEPEDPQGSRNDGNTMGNEHCFGRMVSDGTYIYYRNVYDNARMYSFKKDGSGMTRLLDERVKDLHMIGDWIYYSGEDDNNLFKMKKDGSEKRKLTNIPFTAPESGASFETIVDGDLYYLYGGGPSYGTDISVFDEDTGTSRTIAHIDPDRVTNRISPNVVGDNLYYQQADGIYRCGLDGSNTVCLVPGVVCHEFLMAKGYIYYVTAPGDPSNPQYIGRVKLDGTGQEILAEASAGGYMKLNIHKDKMYYISGYPMGNLCVMDLDGSNQKTFPYVLDWYNIIDGRIYMNSTSQAGEWIPLYSCDLDGNGATELFDVAPFKDLASSGGATAGWYQSGNDWYFRNPDGSLRTGWLQDGGSQYYLEADGKMKLGLWTIDEAAKKGYYFDETGRMQVGTFSFKLNGKDVTYTFYQDGTYSG